MNAISFNDDIFQLGYILQFINVLKGRLYKMQLCVVICIFVFIFALFLLYFWSELIESVKVVQSIACACGRSYDCYEQPETIA